MQLESWIAYLAVAVVATAIPGPAVLLVSSRCIELGLTRSMGVVWGNVSGLLLLCLLAAFGLTVVMTVSAFNFFLLKIAGAIYLIYLGVRMLRTAASQKPMAISSNRSRPSRFSLYGEGVLLAISNPKAVLFTTALFPQFVDRSAPLLSQFAVMAATLMTLSFVCLSAYACAASLLGSRFRAFHNKHLQRVFGGTFIVAGASMALTSR